MCIVTPLPLPTFTFTCMHICVQMQMCFSLAHTLNILYSLNCKAHFIVWKVLYNSFYYFSATQKSWEDSRQDCLAKGADLVIINSEEEQVKEKLVSWIGLSDRDEEGTWRWVDGTFLNSTKFWQKNEPSGTHGRNVKEDCADAFWYTVLDSWNDDACTTAHYWVCEKLIDL
uniref:C-type lectin domain-containing protein n=1 Tax=Myripristis murdjan TaxID=586833 RepID=A0A667XUD4_9TELE